MGNSARREWPARKTLGRSAWRARYTVEHEDELLPDLKTLVDAKLLEWPSGKPDLGTYVYLGIGQKLTGDPRNVLAYEDPQASADEGVNVVFLDGHVQWMRPDALDRAPRETGERTRTSARDCPRHSHRPEKTTASAIVMTANSPHQNTTWSYQ